MKTAARPSPPTKDSKEPKDGLKGIELDGSGPDAATAAAAAAAAAAGLHDAQTILMRFPNTCFGISLGLAGQAIMWKVIGDSPSMRSAFGATGSKTTSTCFWVAACVILAVFSAVYAAKLMLHQQLVHFEWLNAHRAHFFNTPHLAVLMIAIGVPPIISDRTGLRAVLYTMVVVQTILAETFYARWLFDGASNMGAARPPFLLSVIGWLLLSILAQQVDLDHLAAFFFGGGFILYLLVIVSIFLSMHNSIGEKGSPSLFLLIAPPAVAAIALGGFKGTDSFPNEAMMLLGWCCVLLLLLLRLGPKLLAEPEALGAYWAYVFPLSALATGFVKYAESDGTTTSMAVACVFVALSCASLVVVTFRMWWHHVGVVRGKKRWEDPIVGAWQQGQEVTTTRTGSYGSGTANEENAAIAQEAALLARDGPVVRETAAGLGV
jgi:tellurite resistance protein